MRSESDVGPHDGCDEPSGGFVERVVLVGFMAAGKTTVGRLLAERLRWEFVDTDALVEARAGMSVADVFDRLGESEFRAIEADVTAEALGGKRVVIATGGGWPEAPGTLESLPERSLTVWLDAPLRLLLDRAGSDETRRPLLGGSGRADGARSLLERRRPRYARAQVRVETADRGVAEVAEAIARHVTSPTRRPSPRGAHRTQDEKNQLKKKDT